MGDCWRNSFANFLLPSLNLLCSKSHTFQLCSLMWVDRIGSKQLSSLTLVISMKQNRWQCHIFELLSSSTTRSPSKAARINALNPRQSQKSAIKQGRYSLFENFTAASVYKREDVQEIQIWNCAKSRSHSIWRDGCGNGTHDCPRKSLALICDVQSIVFIHMFPSI